MCQIAKSGHLDGIQHHAYRGGHPPACRVGNGVKALPEPTVLLLKLLNLRKLLTQLKLYPPRFRYLGKFAALRLKMSSAFLQAFYLPLLPGNRLGDQIKKIVFFTVL